MEKKLSPYLCNHTASLHMSKYRLVEGVIPKNKFGHVYVLLKKQIIIAYPDYYCRIRLYDIYLSLRQNASSNGISVVHVFICRRDAEFPHVM